MKCRICGNETGERLYCPMCGAAVNPNQEEQEAQTQSESVYHYQGIDADATTVLTIDHMVNEKKEKENNWERKCIVSPETEIDHKSHKIRFLVFGIIGIAAIAAGIAIMIYIWK